MIGLNRLGLPARPALTARIRSEPFLYATTSTPGETVTIHRITPTGGSITISWGDGEATTVAAGVTTAQSHIYAAAGTFEIRVTPLILVTQLDIHDAKLSGFRSAQLAGNVMTYFVCYTLGTGIPSNISTIDMGGWLPTVFQILNMPVVGTYVIDSTHFLSWNPSLLFIYLLPVASTTWNIYANSFSGFRASTNIRFDNNSLNQAQVDAILWGLYQASKSPRTATGGTINVGGTNAAPSGTYQAAAACPVSVATPGKEVAHELVNDTCGAFANHWTTVTFTV